MRKNCCEKYSIGQGQKRMKFVWECPSDVFAHDEICFNYVKFILHLLSFNRLICCTPKLRVNVSVISIGPIRTFALSSL